MWDVKYRPRKFSDVLGQEGSVRLLQSRLRNGTALDTSYVFSGGHGQGKCVGGDTLVPTDKGLVPIRSLMGPNQIDPLAVQIWQEQGAARAAYSYRGGLRETLRVRTYLGFELEGTPNHCIQVLAPSGTIEWKSLSDITEGDYACIVRKGLFGVGADISGFHYTPSEHDYSSIEFTPPTELTPVWGSLMGFMIGDGACRHRSSVSISCAELDVRAEILRILRELGGEGQETPDKCRPGLTALRCSRVQFRAFLAFLGVAYAGAARKTIPWSVLASPKPVVAAFLRSYFECDGSVSGQVLEVITKSRELARQLQVLLLQFGIVSRRFKKHHQKYGIFWRVRIMGTSVDLFRSRIGFVSKRKHSALDDFANRLHATGRRNLSNAYDVVPYQTRALRAFYAGLPSKSRNRDTSNFFRARRGTVACTTRQVERIAREFRDAPGAFPFVRLQESGYIFDPVVGITSDESEVFDLNVPDGEMFAANGFMNHNTTLARILARAMLCENLAKADPAPEPCNECDNCKAILDDTSGAFVEMDAASRGTIDNVRAIVDDLPFAVFGAPKRIYLFDEAHRMSQNSQDVLLKPLEEKKFVGIFCTTEPEKIRGTIRSRCEHYTIRKVTREDILARAKMVLTSEGVEYEDDAVLIAIDYSGGHVRDILNRLEMISQMGPVNIANTRAYLRLSVVATYYEVLLALDDPSKAVALVEQACEQVSPEEVASGLAEAAMNSYRLAFGMHADFTHMDRALGQKVYERFRGDTIRLAEYFLRSRYVTQVSLACDILSWSQVAKQTPVISIPYIPQPGMTQPPPAPTFQPAVNAPAPQAVAPSPAPAAPTAVPGPKISGGNGKGSAASFQDVSQQLTPLDPQVIGEHPRRRQDLLRDSLHLSRRLEEENQQFTAVEWRREFEKLCKMMADPDPGSGDEDE